MKNHLSGIKLSVLVGLRVPVPERRLCRVRPRNQDPSSCCGGHRQHREEPGERPASNVRNTAQVLGLCVSSHSHLRELPDVLLRTA